MNVVFSDIDGVLRPTFSDDIAPARGLSPVCIAHWNRIVANTNAKVVITSVWRDLVLRGDMTLRGLYVLLHSHGWSGDLIGVTPSLPKSRSEEIAAYLKEHPCDRYVVIDDHAAAGKGHPFVQTNSHTGLTRIKADLAVQILEGRCQVAA